MTTRILFFLLLFLFSAQIVMAEIMSVKGDNVNLRAEPNTSSHVKWEYGKGFPLQVIENKGDWVKVSDFEKDSGWIHRSMLTKTPHVIVKMNKNSTRNINIRSNPSTNSAIVGKAYYGVVFEKLEAKSGWIKVRHETGLVGWIMGSLLWGN